MRDVVEVEVDAWLPSRDAFPTKRTLGVATIEDMAAALSLHASVHSTIPKLYMKIRIKN